LDPEGADERMIKAVEHQREGRTRWVKNNPKKNPILSGPYPI
jgi:hypothetical protein